MALFKVIETVQKVAWVEADSEEQAQELYDEMDDFDKDKDALEFEIEMWEN